MRNEKLKEIRADLTDSTRYAHVDLCCWHVGAVLCTHELTASVAIARRFFAGKNKVMKIALGTEEATSFRKNLYKLADVRICEYVSCVRVTHVAYVCMCD